MALSILNNLSAMTAENNLDLTQTSLQNTLTQLSSGSRINSGSDDPAGLSIANGLTANIAALTQSVQNATNGTGLLQTADGALSQVTTLLNQAVTLATEASNGGLSIPQAQAIQTEYATILTQIGNIGSTTNFNGNPVFTSNAVNSSTSVQAGLSGATTMTDNSVTTIHDSSTGGTFVYTATGASTLATLKTAIDNAVSAGTLSSGTDISYSGTGQMIISGAGVGVSQQVSTNDAKIGNMNPTVVANNSATVYLGDGTTGGHQIVTTSISSLTTGSPGLGLGLTANPMESTTSAATELYAINTAIGTIAADRGTIGANVNELTAATNVMNNQVQNLTSAESGVSDADIGKTVANMTKYTTLQQTGIAALQQSNQASQTILKLLQ